MNTAASSTSDDRTIEDVTRQQMDRLDEMHKLDGDVIGLNNAYIDILDRITNKLDLLATLADEIETDARKHPESMDDTLKKRFDLLSQSSLMNRYMCTKAIFQNAIGAIQSMQQFGSDYITNQVNAPFHATTCDSTQDASTSQPRPSDVSERTIASDSDATVAARLDDSNLSVMSDEAANNNGPSDFIPPQSLHAPSTLLLEQQEMEIENENDNEEEEKEREDNYKEDELMEDGHEAIPKDPVETVTVLADSEREIDRDCDEPISIAESIKSIEFLEQKKRKKKKKKRSKSSEQRRRSREAEKMENILNQHLKRSRETKPKKTKDGAKPDGPRTSTPISKDIEVVTLSDDDLIRPMKISRIDNDQMDRDRFFNSRIIPGPKTPPIEDYENYIMGKEGIQDIKIEEVNTSISGSSQVLATLIHPPNVLLSPSIPSIPSAPSIPDPVPSPILPLSLGRGPGFVAAPMQEAQPTPSNWSQLNAESSAIEDQDSSCEKSMIMERPESRVEEDNSMENKRKEGNLRKDSRCDSRGSLKERLEEEIRLRESGRFSPDKRGRSRSLSYSPQRDRSRSRGRSRSRSRERRDWRSSNRYRLGYRQRYQRWSRSRTRSRSLSRTRYRSSSRDRDDWRRSRSRDRDDYRRSPIRSRYRSISRDRYRSRSRSGRRTWSRSRSVSRERRSITPLTPDGREEREVSSPIPRAYARFRNRSSERREKKKEMDGKEEEVAQEETVPSPTVEVIDSRIPAPSSSILAPPPPPPLIAPMSPPHPHSSSSSPSTFIPPPLIVIPTKPPPLKISIPSTLPTRIKSGKGGSIRPNIPPSSVQSTPASSSTSLNTNPTHTAPPPNGSTIDASKRTIVSSSDMSLEGNTMSEGSNGRSKSVRSGEEILLDIPTPPLSNPSAMEPKKWVEGDQLNGYLPPPLPPLPQPPLPTTNRSMEISPLADANTSSRVSSVCTPTGTPSSIGIRSSNGRSLGPYPLHSYHAQQYYQNSSPHNPYAYQNGWMNGEAQWQQYYHPYNQDGGMMGANYGCPPGSLHPSPVVQGPVPEAHGSFIKAMRVIPSPMNPPPDWAQMAREHANQQMHGANMPPQPLLGQQAHMMGHHHDHHHHYGTPQSGRGGSRFRGGGGKGRRW